MYQCPHCPNTYKYPDRLRAHIIIKHTHVEQQPKDVWDAITQATRALEDATFKDVVELRKPDSPLRAKLAEVLALVKELERVTGVKLTEEHDHGQQS